MGAHLSRQWPFSLSPYLSSAEGMILLWGWSLLHPCQHPTAPKVRLSPNSSWSYGRWCSGITTMPQLASLLWGLCEDEELCLPCATPLLCLRTGRSRITLTPRTSHASTPVEEE